MRRIIRIAVLTIACVALIVGYYYHLTRTTPTQPTESTVNAEPESELDKILQTDLSKDYPQTPREVVKWYNRVLALYYSQTLTDDQISAVASKVYQLFDKDLQGENPLDEYTTQVRYQIGDYKTKGITLVESKVESTRSIGKEKVNGKEMAYVLAYYFLQSGGDYNRTYQKYALRKDNKGNYKIVDFRLADENGRVLESDMMN